MKSARQQVLTVLARVLDQGESLTPVLNRYSASLPLSEQGLLKELAFGSLRWYLRLTALLQQLVNKPLRARDRDLQLVLITSLYQLEYLRVPDYAAVDSAVKLTRDLGKSWASKLVNGVLRQFLRDRDALCAALELDPLSQHAMPAWLYERLRSDWPEAWPQILAASNQQAPMSLRVNRRRADWQDYGARLQAAGFSATAHPHAPDAWVLDQAAAVTALPGFAEGEVAVQDAGAQLAAPLLAAEPGQRVLDACAAPGGKTCHLLETQQDLRLLALDLEAERQRRVVENLQRLGLQAEVKTADLAAVEQWWDGQLFERILLDAPCSATGVIRRHPDIKHLRRADDLPELAATQLRLLRAVWPTLAPGGMLLYATCSICRMENDGVIAQFLASTPSAQDDPIAASWGQALSYGRQILPGEDRMDGFYYARLRKLA